MAHAPSAVLDAAPGDDRFLDYVRELTQRDGAQDAAVDVRAVTVDPATAGAGRIEGPRVSRHVVGPNDALAVVRDYLARGVAFRSSRRTAVVVEEFIAADASAQVVSGVREPFAEKVAVVKAAHGVCAGGTDHAGAADTYLVRRTDLNILVEWIAEKHRQVVPTPSGLTERPLPAALRNRPCLTEEQIRDMVRISLVAEVELGLPVRLELAWKNGAVYVLWCEAVA
ncbi:PEP/pyruvate-binding domain-containing protein [Streptomyces winkii]|uniref:PEP/pyruvate-binding domain-containing protein n=1 Tax=Streptomyces winkii TaxID=3051178 RepID=UPI0028D46BF1|nr:PEP/pyruvate-binding domain-containing protein [Streptomyces sp. DSM 40971]